MDWSERFKEKMRYVTHEDIPKENFWWLMEEPERTAWLGEAVSKGEMYELPRPKWE